MHQSVDQVDLAEAYLPGKAGVHALPLGGSVDL